MYSIHRYPSFEGTPLYGIHNMRDVFYGCKTAGSGTELPLYSQGTVVRCTVVFTRLYSPLYSQGTHAIMDTFDGYTSVPYNEGYLYPNWVPTNTENKRR